MLSLGLLSGAQAAARPLRGGLPVQPAQTGPVPTPAPPPEPPVKAVPLSGGHQPKPLRVDDDGLPTDHPTGPNQPNHGHRAGRAAHHAHGPGPGHGHGHRH